MIKRIKSPYLLILIFVLGFSPLAQANVEFCEKENQTFNLLSDNFSPTFFNSQSNLITINSDGLFHSSEKYIWILIQFKDIFDSDKNSVWNHFLNKIQNNKCVNPN